MEKSGTAHHVSYDGIIQCMCFVCWVTKGTDTHSEYAILIDFFYGNSGFSDLHQ